MTAGRSIEFFSAAVVPAARNRCPGALGARTVDVVLLVSSDGVWIALAGLSSGLLVASLLRRSFESMLFGVKPDDALTFGGVALVLGVVALLSAYFPARPAARIDPAAALRAE